MRYGWTEAFRIDALDHGWDDAPSTAGVYVISCGRPLRRVGGIDPTGIIYIGQSLCVRDRLWTYWEAQHQASGMLWDMPEVARAIFGGPVHANIDKLLGASLIWASTPIPRARLDDAERAVLFSYTLRYGEPPPLNATLPGRWTKRPAPANLKWAMQGLDPKRLTKRSTRRVAARPAGERGR